MVFEPPPIPEFVGHYKPDTRQVQRLRFRCLPAAGLWCMLSALPAAESARVLLLWGSSWLLPLL